MILASSASLAQSAAPYESLCPGIAAETAAPRAALSLDDVRSAVSEVRAAHYPDLAGFAVRTAPLDSESDFLRASVDFRDAWKPGPKRNYLLLVSPRLLASPPSPRALRAILTHELSHIDDYARMNALQLADFAAGYALEPIRAYERRTDETALRKGEACGLIEYRLWLYSRETGAALAAKKRDYETPDEIADWMRAHAAAGASDAAAVESGGTPRPAPPLL
jgi:hypothetical protein